MTPKLKEQTKPTEPASEQLPQPSLMEIQEKLGLFDQQDHAKVEAQSQTEVLEEKPLSFI